MQPGILALIAAAAVAVGALGGSHGPTSTAGGVERGASAEAPVARGATAEELVAGLAANDTALRDAIDAWRAEEDPPSSEPPSAVMDGARYLQETVRTLARRPGLARDVIAKLPAQLAGQIRKLTLAQRDLIKLSSGWPAHDVETGNPEPLANLSSYYDEARQRSEIHQHYLAAIHFVESKFGRVKNDSVAGAQGPMQFIPSTWDIYGQGSVHDDHDAILAAARLLRDNGAPDDYRRALRAYNNSGLYVDAVQRYARQIKRDPHALYFFYCFGP
jgi:membrane-bound lytic murein transglycosylase B